MIQPENNQLPNVDIESGPRKIILLAKKKGCLKIGWFTSQNDQNVVASASNLTHIPEHSEHRNCMREIMKTEI